MQGWITTEAALLPKLASRTGTYQCQPTGHIALSSLRLFLQNHQSHSTAI